MSLEIAMQWNTTYTESVHTFANTINTHEGGTHEEGFRAALTSVVNTWGEEWGLIKKPEDRVSGDDIREGLTAIISIKLERAAVRGPDQDQARQHRGQAASCSGVVYDQLGALVAKQPGRGQANRPQGPGRGPGADRGAQGARPGPLAQGPARRRRPARQARRLPVDQPRGVRGLHRRGRLGGRLGQAGRDSRIQAILPIRGKILNVEKARIDKVLANTEVQAIISALGTGIHEEFDIDKLRYHKVVLMADADVDGHHINTLLLTLLFRFMRPLIERRLRLHGPAAALPDALEQARTSTSSSTPTPSATS